LILLIDYFTYRRASIIMTATNDRNTEQINSTRLDNIQGQTSSKSESEHLVKKTEASKIAGSNIQEKHRASPLKVVPPCKNDSPPAPTKETTSNAAPASKSSSSFPMRRILMIGGIVVGLGFISQIPISTSVKADARLEPVPANHQVVYTEISGKVTDILVQPNQSLQENQPIAVISTDDMDGDIADVSAKFESVLSDTKSLEGQIVTLEAKVNEATVREDAVRRQLSELRYAKEHLPEIDKLHQEIAALRSNIAGLTGKISGRRTNLGIVQARLGRYKTLVEVGALAQNNLDELMIQESTISSEINTILSEISGVEKQIASLLSEIQIVTLRKQQELNQRQDEVNAMAAARLTAYEQLKAVKGEVASKEPLLRTLRNELARRQDKQVRSSVLKAKKSGFVISQDFHKLLGKKMAAGEPVLEVADLGRLVAIIEVPQADGDVIKEGSGVTFRPLEPGLPSYSTRLSNIELVMQPDVSMQKQVLRVRALVDNSSGRLIPGAKVYAEIESSSMPLYLLVQRELMKLFSFRKYGLGG
jgi:multidrug efflux pump subunit AcrA (membrane-fusion protein)